MVDLNMKQTDAASLKPGNYVVFDNVACVVKSVQKSKTGKHGSAKCRVEAVAINDGRKIIKILPGHDNVFVPIIEKRTAQVLSMVNDKANVMDVDTYETFDITIPDEIKEDIKEGAQVAYWTMLGQKVLRGKK
ncbi:MAG: translation initiation factor IF-5A [Nanoarchaeota archaeon]